MIDFRTFILSFDGTPIKADGKEIMIGECCITAVLNPEQGLDGNESVKRFKLANKIHDALHTLGGSIELEAEEIALIKKQVAKLFGPMIVGRVYAAIDPASVEAKKAKV